MEVSEVLNEENLAAFSGLGRCHKTVSRPALMQAFTMPITKDDNLRHVGRNNSWVLLMMPRLSTYREVY